MQNYFLGWKHGLWSRTRSILGAGWLWWGLGLKQCLFLMGSGDAWLGRHPWVLWFHVCTVARPMTHAWLRAVEIPTDYYHTSCLWAAIRWVPATPTSRTLSLTHSVAAHLSGLWVTLWQMWHQFHFGGAASYRYSLHNRKCRPGKKKKGDEKLAGLGRRQGFLKGLSPSPWDSDGNDLLYKGDTSLHRSGCDEMSSGSSVVKTKGPNEASRDVGPAFDIAPCGHSSFTHFLDLG